MVLPFTYNRERAFAGDCRAKAVRKAFRAAADDRLDRQKIIYFRIVYVYCCYPTPRRKTPTPSRTDSLLQVVQPC